jgi:hypothetical protein
MSTYTRRHLKELNIVLDLQERYRNIFLTWQIGKIWEK